MAGHFPVEEDPVELARAQAIWANFVCKIKWGIPVLAVLLLLLAAAFVPFSS